MASVSFTYGKTLVQETMGDPRDRIRSQRARSLRGIECVLGTS